MGDFFHGVFQTFFLIGYVILYIVTILILQPFRYHRRRLKSTILLKMSYLLYLASFLAFTYLLLFGKKEITDSEKPYDTLFNIHFLFLSHINHCSECWHHDPAQDPEKQGGL